MVSRLNCFALTNGFDGSQVRAAAKATRDGPQVRRLLALAAIYGGGTRNEAARTGVMRSRLVDLCQWLWDEHQVSVAKQTLGRELRAMHYRKLSARPRHQAQAKCPELNPQESVWQFGRDTWLSNRVFTSCDNRVDHCCAAWNRLTDAPWAIVSLGLRNWTHEF